MKIVEFKPNPSQTTLKVYTQKSRLRQRKIVKEEEEK